MVGKKCDKKWVLGWAARKPDAVAEVDAAFARAGRTIDELMAETLALREIDRHRATLGAALRHAADEVLDAEFKEVPPRLIEGEAV